MRQCCTLFRLMLLAFLNGKYIGNCSLMGNAPSRYRHRASVGIALFQAYTGMGIGRKMLELLCEIAKEKGIKKSLKESLIEAMAK